MKKTLLFLALAAVTTSVAASICTLGAKDESCSFASDTSSGAVLYQNPSQLSNIGSGVINPFLGSQVSGPGGSDGVEFGVNTDQAATNQLPLNDKRDNSNTFTETMRLNQLGFVTVGGQDYFSFFLDINEPNNDIKRFLSIDRLAIFGRTGVNAGDPLDLNKTNITSLADVDVFPNLSLVYRLGIDNNLILNGDLFSGSGLGYDLNMLVPTFLFDNLSPVSRIVLAVQYGGADVPGAIAQDGFEEWAFLPGSGRVPNPVPEPGSLALLSLGMIGLVGARKLRR